MISISTFNNFFSMKNSPSTSWTAFFIHSNNFGSFWINIRSWSYWSEFFFKTSMAKQAIIKLSFQILSWQRIQILLTTVTFETDFVINSSFGMVRFQIIDNSLTFSTSFWRIVWFYHGWVWPTRNSLTIPTFFINEMGRSSPSESSNACKSGYFFLSFWAFMIISF